ncbi:MULTISPECIES: hypothetical protein [Streptomyces]|uniref:hypothetical protein n=1 Tax=Streptomyces TaxID=1883 RepID=UPI000BF1C115|nr:MULTISPECIES: hypothetical protein [Streptomyces]UPT46795.1 hypothetical protein MWG59_38795 [Streptomyces sp. WAC00303]WIY80912.1 hypothetical protein QPM16_38425 [Streptomyces anulatus]WTF67069.1 hypothetical protein OH791_39220 [Streptomyces anulatus]
MALKQWAASRRLKPGDGRELQRFRWWQLPVRSLFWLRLLGDGGQERLHAIDVRYGARLDDSRIRAHLFLDGRHVAESKLPALFPVDGGVIEVAMSSYGIKRCHYRPLGGRPSQLTPDPASAEGRRARFGARHPGLSGAITVGSVLLLVIGVGLNLLQLAEPVSEIPPVAQRVGAFDSPIHLPIWLNLALGGGAVLASMERALRLRYSSLLDAAGH